MRKKYRWTLALLRVLGHRKITGDGRAAGIALAVGTVQLQIKLLSVQVVGSMNQSSTVTAHSIRVVLLAHWLVLCPPLASQLSLPVEQAPRLLVNVQLN